MSLVKIEPQKHNVMISIAYATEHNVTGKPIYANPGCYLRPEAEACLNKAVELAAPMGYTIKVWDAFRPHEAQFKLWEGAPFEGFVADPNKGSPHTRGVAIDLTLVDAEGNELDMGTPFDDFTPQSFQTNIEISPEAQRNRRILLGIMTAAGWDYFENEWWHFQLHNAKQYELIKDGPETDYMMKG